MCELCSFVKGLGAYTSSTETQRKPSLIYLQRKDCLGLQYGSKWLGYEITRETNFMLVRLTGSPIARDLEKSSTEFTEGAKCWPIASIGHGRTRPVSLWVGSTDRKSDYERRRKIHRSAYSGCEMSHLQYISPTKSGNMIDTPVF